MDSSAQPAFSVIAVGIEAGRAELGFPAFCPLRQQLRALAFISRTAALFPGTLALFFRALKPKGQQLTIGIVPAHPIHLHVAKASAPDSQFEAKVGNGVAPRVIRLHAVEASILTPVHLDGC